MPPAMMRREGVRRRERPEQALAASHARRHLCFVAPLAWPVFSGDARIGVIGGAEVQQSLLARLFARHGYRVSMICLDYGQPELVLLDGVTVHKTCGPSAGIPVLRFLHPRLTSMWRALGRVDADLYYTRSASMLAGIVAAFCRRHGKRSIYAGASDMDFVPGHRQIRFARDRWLYDYGLRHADAIVVQNRAQLESCRRHYAREAALIPSGYEKPAQARAARGDRVLWVGTVIPSKRPEMLLALARALPGRRFTLVGGPGVDAVRGYYDAIRSAAAALPNVEMTGFVPLAEVERWFDRARVLVNTSTYEGMPNTFLQAWSRGVPSVATVDVGAGIYPVFGDPAEGARDIERLFADEAHWQRASARCLEYWRAHHSTAEVLARYERLFAKLQ